MKTIQPYELLIRWKNGVISGAHVRTLTTFTDDITGEFITQREGEAASIDLPNAIALLQAPPDAQMAEQIQTEQETSIVEAVEATPSVWSRVRRILGLT